MLDPATTFPLPANPQKPRRRRTGLAWLLTIHIYDGHPKPKFSVPIPLPLFLCLALFLELLAFVVLHIAALVMLFRPKLTLPPLARLVMKAVRSQFLLTRLSFALMRHGGRLEVCAIDGNSGVVIAGR